MQRVKMAIGFLWVSATVFFSASSFAADTVVPDTAVPEPLQAWREWVLDAHKDFHCPPAYAALAERQCRWPGRLQLDVDAAGAGFTQEWQLYADGWVSVPGDAQAWPQAVRANDKTVAVIVREGLPAIWLAAGEYRVQGVIRWDTLPTRLALPVDTALLALTLHGKPVANPGIDDTGQLLLGENRAQQETVADDLSVQVFRQLIDDIPVQLETVVRFKVAGRDREVLLGRLLPAGMQPLVLDSPLPARIEPDGRLRMQLRAGEWELHLRARAEGQPTNFSMQRMDTLWPEEEIWSLQDNRSLRQITLSGVASIDPSQTGMPAAWRKLPAWLLHDGEQLSLSEQQRGESAVSTGSGEWALQRDIWLDFAGEAFTSRDVVSGTLNSPVRLTMAAGQELGSADINGEPQLITQMAGQAAGVELRPGPFSLRTLSRIPRKDALPATAWQQDFASVSAQLHLPPGWMLLHADGVDTAQTSWVARWNLWAIFLVLIIAASSLRLLGWKVGLLALLTLLLTYHTQHAPVYLWLSALVALTLQRVLPAGRLQRVLNVYMGISFILLALVLLRFSVEQVRMGIYPQLELGTYASIQTKSSSPAEPEPEPKPMAAAPAFVAEEMAGASSELSADGSQMDYLSNRVAKQAPKREALRTGYDSSAKVQTGPGEPAWQWQRVRLQWSGPVTQQQGVHLYLMSPAWHRLWNALSVALVFALAAVLLRSAYPLVGLRLQTGKALSVMIMLMASVTLALPQSLHADIPDKALLDELEQRLTRLPACEPVCASFTKGQLQLDNAGLRIELQIDAQETVAVPLPSARNQWQPRTVLIDGKTASSLRRDDSGLLWVAVTAGSHRLTLEGPLNGDELVLPFEMDVHNLTVQANGWQVSGLVNGRVPGHSLQFARSMNGREQRASAGEANGTDTQLLADTAPVFLRITRTVTLGRDWQVQTHVQRLAPQVGAINAEVNVLAGEAVLTPGIEQRDGRVQVVMSASQSEFFWHSSLKQSEVLRLQAAAQAPWVERWQLDIAPIWHVVFSGINPIKQNMQAGGLPTWQPWPGESLQMDISRPPAVIGNTRTVESARLTYSPGERASDAVLLLHVRSSQGGELPVDLPVGSTVQYLNVDGIEQSGVGDDQHLRLPLHPGSQQLEVRWRQNDVLATRTSTPLPVINEAVSNINLTLNVPQGRWLLAVGGPAMGPALLFWGVLVVMLLVAFALGRAGIAPVKTWQWLLLGLGMSTVTAVGSVLVVLWFAALAKRQNLQPHSMTRSRFNTLQILLVLLTLVALGCLVGTIPMSLLSSPNMQVVGNHSSATELLWYQDRMAQGLPQAWMISVPMWVYRSVMLVWSLWLVFALLDWCRWGWNSFSAGALWRGKDDEVAMTLDASVLSSRQFP